MDEILYSLLSVQIKRELEILERIVVAVTGLVLSNQILVH